MKIKVILFLSVVIFLTNSLHASENAIHLYVSELGNDNWSGFSKSSQPDQVGPFATISRAMLEIREIKKKNTNLKKDIIVNILKGTYRLKKPLEFSYEDGGTIDSHIYYIIDSPIQTTISGSKVIQKTGEYKNKDNADSRSNNILISDLSTHASRYLTVSDICKWPCVTSEGRSELFFNKKRMNLAKWPNTDTKVNTSGLIQSTSSNRTEFKLKNKIPQSWNNEKNIWLHGYWYWDWADHHIKIKYIDYQNRKIIIEEPGHRFGYRLNNKFIAYNIFSELDEPGEWYLSDKNKLYYWPPIDGSTHLIELSHVNPAIKLNNTSNITFKNLSIENISGTAITISKGESINILNCRIKNTSSWGIIVTETKNSMIDNCDITETGGGGIYVNSGDRKKLIPSNFHITNNRIYNYAKWIKAYQPGIKLDGVGSVVRGNIIYNAPHQAIGLKGNDHIIEYNTISDVCKESNDAGAIYAGADWTMRGTTIKHNYFKDINGLNGNSAAAIYLDDLFSGTLVIGNVFNKVTRPVIIGGGRDNIIKENIFINAVNPISLDDRGLNTLKGAVHSGLKYSLSQVPYKSEIWRKKYPNLFNIWDDDPGAPKDNQILSNINIGKRWLSIRDNALQYTLIKDNHLDVAPDIINESGTRFNINQEDFEERFGFSPPQIEKIFIH